MHNLSPSALIHDFINVRLRVPIHDSIDCGFPFVRQLPLPSLCFVCERDSVTDIQASATHSIVVTISLMLLLFPCMLLSNASGFVEVCHQFPSVGLVVNHDWVSQHLTEDQIDQESENSTIH